MLLTTKDLLTKFGENIGFSDRIDIASAWLTHSPALELLNAAHKERGVKIRAIIGTYGNATDPDSLEYLSKICKLCVVGNRESMFHPKIYVFRSGQKSCAWVGSANFTLAGFKRNLEVVQEVSNNVQTIVDWFDCQWKDNGGESDISAIEDYRERRKHQGVSYDVAKLIGQPEIGKDKRLDLLKNANSWHEYVEAIKRCEDSWKSEGRPWSVLDKKCSYVHTISQGQRVARMSSWIDLNNEEKTILLGLQDGPNGMWKLLGSLSAAGTVRGVFNNSKTGENQRTLKSIRESLNLVLYASEGDFPAVAEEALGQIRRKGRFSHGTGTRLLSLARPDRLVSVNNGSRVGLAETFGLKPTTLGEPKNYRLLLERLYDKPWYSGLNRRSKRDQQLWSLRAALIDSFVYDPNA